MRLVDAANTWNPALIVFKEKGFYLRIQPSDCETEVGLWCAEKEHIVLKASDPLALLGLAALHEHRGDMWRRMDDEDLSDILLGQTYGDD